MKEPNPMEQSTSHSIDPINQPLPQAASSTIRIDAASEWRHWLTGLTMGLLLYETLSGFAIYLTPFSKLNQFGVL